jgi:hypothetical protein
MSKSFVPKLCQKRARFVPSFPFPASLNRQQSTAMFTTRSPPRTATSALVNKANVRGRTAFVLSGSCLAHCRCTIPCICNVGGERNR